MKRIEKIYRMSVAGGFLNYKQIKITDVINIKSFHYDKARKFN
jgi:hypothetical protein